jgi:hypothetical protein
MPVACLIEWDISEKEKGLTASISMNRRGVADEFDWLLTTTKEPR